MTYSGHVMNGEIVLDTPATLPEGASVTIRLIDGGSDPSREPPSRRAMLQMPVEQRRQLLAQQAQSVGDAYTATIDLDWQAGDIVE